MCSNEDVEKDVSFAIEVAGVKYYPFSLKPTVEHYMNDWTDPTVFQIREVGSGFNITCPDCDGYLVDTGGVTIDGEGIMQCECCGVIYLTPEFDED
jgi:hypothetical protein